MSSRQVPQQIMEIANTLSEGSPLTAKALLHLGSRAAVDQALARLTRSGKLLRVQRGLFMRPIQTKFGRRAPSVPEVIGRLAETTGETITPSGAAVANSLGLTTQVPARVVYLTSGRSRRLRVGAQMVELRHAPRWELSLPDQPAGAAIRVLTWLRKNGQVENQEAFMNTLSVAERQNLLEVRGRLPEWLATQVSALAVHG